MPLAAAVPRVTRKGGLTNDIPTSIENHVFYNCSKFIVIRNLNKLDKWGQFDQKSISFAQADCPRPTLESCQGHIYRSPRHSLKA